MLLQVPGHVSRDKDLVGAPTNVVNFPGPRRPALSTIQSLRFAVHRLNKRDSLLQNKAKADRLTDLSVAVK